MFTAESLPNRLDYAAAQKKWYAFWEQQGYFHAEPDDARPPYSIVIPPPNVTGALHLGHALNNTLQDIVVRMKRMQGYNAMWMPGTDHAGIATQAVVERRLLEEENKTRHDLGREQLVERIWNWKHEYEKRIIGQLKQMGCSCDWQRTRFTLDDVCARAVRQTFFDFFDKGLIYRGKRLVNWDCYLQTAVSDDEVENKTVKGHFWHYRYPVIDPQPGEPEFVTIATTRPETMLGDTAVAVHPNPSAALAKAEAELIEKFAAAPGKEKPAIQAEIDEIRHRQETVLAELETLRAMAAAGRMLMLPLVERPIPLVADEWAKPELGSGCVKITPAHDPNDYEVWQRHKRIGAINILNPDGTLNDNAGPYKGQTIDTARKNVVADLEARGLMDKIEDRDIELPHSDRSKKPIEPYLADQWFMKMDALAQTAMDAVTSGRVKIIPERYAKGYLDWLSEKRDWPIGRQLWWGHRIPIWSKPAAAGASVFDVLAETLTPPELKHAVAEQLVQNEDSGQWTLQACVAPGHENIEQTLESHGFVQDDEVLDTWFSSALWPHSTLGWPEKTAELAYWYPTNVLITSRDIITLWVARMVLTGLNNVGEIPFREVYIHPTILDGDGERMAKSKGNGVDPLDVIQKFGADALRFGLAYLTTEQQDVRMPVQFECPHCEKHIEQHKNNRMLPRIVCEHCKEPFSTQWAQSDADKALPRGAVISERYEIARNFANKLWNASRFTLLKLDGYAPAPIEESDLTLEDRWILSR
ncbi:MAG: class I tRNA ligase family protein, partial [Planctomycetales bacterium]|nr:class I tRNA ligase family protein [Planctomycetales bacterium]